MSLNLEINFESILNRKLALIQITSYIFDDVQPTVTPNTQQNGILCVIYTMDF